MSIDSETGVESVMSRKWSDLVAIGRVARSQGRLGEVAIEPFADVPERFEGLERVFLEGLEGPGGEPTPFAVDSVRVHKGRPVLKLAGVSDIGAARALSGKEVRVPESELEPLPEGSYYHFEMKGLEVVDRELGHLGEVEDVLSTGGTDVLVVRGADGEENLVPLCAEICPRIDPRRGRIEIDAPEGLLGLNEH